MRRRVSSLTIGLPRNARDTVGCDTPARYAMSCEVGLFCTPHPPRRPAVTGGYSLWPTDHAIAKPAPPLTAGRTPGSTVTGLLSVLVLAVVLGALAPPEAAARTAVIRSVFGTLPDGGVV